LLYENLFVVLCRFAHTIHCLDHCISHFLFIWVVLVSAATTAVAVVVVAVAVAVMMTGFAPFSGRSDGVRKVNSVAVVGERVINIEQRD
jgi:hypothetical protein